MNNNTSQVIIYQSEDGKISVETLLKDESLWLNAHQIAKLFEIDRSGIVKHLKKIYETGELQKESTCAKNTQVAKDGKKRKTDCFSTKDLLRIIQSIPSPKAEPFKLWLAKFGYERIEETEDPELSIDRAMQTYLKKGYSKDWINQRLKTIEVRKNLTDEWEERGVKKGLEFAILTDKITKAWSGKSG